MRLDIISRALSEAFRQAGEEQRRHAALLACEIAVSETGLHGEAVDAALKIICRGGNEAAVRLEIATLSERLDSEYLRFHEQDEAAPLSEELLQFRKARVAAALAFALSADPEQLHDALYEAAFAADDQASVVRTVEAALREARPATG